MMAMDRTEESLTDSVVESARKKAPEAVWQGFGEHGARRVRWRLQVPLSVHLAPPPLKSKHLASSTRSFPTSLA